MPKEIKDFRSISIKRELVEKVEQFIAEHPEYKGIADFIHEATRIRMEEIKRNERLIAEKELPRFEHFNKGPDGVRITDRKLHRIADLYFKPTGIFCDLDKTDTCEHIDFALSVPEIKEIINQRRKEGWKLPDP